MGFKLGPILSFRGLGGESNVEWRVSALIVQDSADGEPSLEWQADVPTRGAASSAGAAAPAKLLATLADAEPAASVAVRFCRDAKRKCRKNTLPDWWAIVGVVISRPCQGHDTQHDLHLVHGLFIQ